MKIEYHNLYTHFIFSTESRIPFTFFQIATKVIRSGPEAFLFGEHTPLSSLIGYRLNYRHQLNLSLVGDIYVEPQFR